MSSPQREGDLVGRSLGSYRVEGHLGSGSMAQVYRARDVLTRSEVALKVHTRKENEASKRRFLQEARAANLMRHPGIVEVLELGAEGETTFIAMELVRGAPLNAVLAGGALPWAETARLMMQIASALGHAHAAGVMHRDLKPSNVLLTHEGQVKLVDFGLAKRVSAMPDVGDGATVWDWSDVHTQPGAVLGTPAYMAPEQARAVHVDARADVFALGVLTWETLVGKPLFRRATPAATLRAILLETAPDPRTLVSDVPPWLAAIVMRALEKDPAARYEDARELLTEMKAALGTDSSEREIVPTALSRIAERRSMALAEPPLSGRAREVDLLSSALEPASGEAIVLGMPGSGRKRVARHALGRIGATRPLVIGLADGASLKAAFLERAYDSVVLDARRRPGHEVLAEAREALGPRVRIAVVAETSAPEIPQVAITGLSPAEGADLLCRGLLGVASDPILTDPRGALGEIAKGVGGHPQSLLAIANRLGTDEASAIAASLEIEEGWPEVLSSLGTLKAWIIARLETLDDAARRLLAAIAVVPSLTEQDALALAIEVGAGAAVIDALRATPLLDRFVHAEMLSAPRLAVPALVRRVLFDRGQAVARRDDRTFLLRRLAERCAEAAREALEVPERETIRELRAERDTVLSLVTRALLDAGPGSGAPSHSGGRALEDAAITLVALAEAGALTDPDGGSGESIALRARPGSAPDAATLGDHLLGRVLSRSVLPAALTLRAMLVRCTAGADPGASRHTAGIDDTLALAQVRGDASAQARVLLARAEREQQVSHEPAAAMQRDIDEALELLPASATVWERQAVLEHAGELWWSMGRADPARGAYRNALALAEERRDARGQARLRHRLSRLDAALGNVDDASRDETAALELAIASGDAILAARIESALGELAILFGELDAARAQVDRAAARGPMALPRAALVAGHIELIEGRLARAQGLYGSALHHATQFHDEPAIAVAHASLAAALACAGDRANASDSLVRATLAARTQPPAVRSVVAGWRGHLERAFLDRDRAVGHGESGRFHMAEARFEEAGLVSGSGAEAGTGARIGAHVLRHARGVD